MDSVTRIRSVTELVKILDREKALLNDMFERRKSLAYRHDFAMTLVNNKHDGIKNLIDHGIIHETGDFLELQDEYVRFFEEILATSESISIASVREYLDSLKENMDYYLVETNDRRRLQYRRNIRSTLRRIGLRTLNNVVDLKRNMDDAFKQAPNPVIKKMKLVKLDEKRKSIYAFMKECEEFLDKQTMFFGVAADSELNRTSLDVRNDFTDAYHNLLEIERQIIEYINRVELQDALFKKLRKLEYVIDQMTWREDTDILQVLDSINPIWMENRQYLSFPLSLDMLANDEYCYQVIRRVGSRNNVAQTERKEAEPIDPDFLNGKTVTVQAVNMSLIWNEFKAQGKDLFNFIKDFHYKQPRSLEDHVNLFYKMASVYYEYLTFSEIYNTLHNIEYQLLYAK